MIILNNLPKGIVYFNLHLTNTINAAKEALKGLSGIYCITCLVTGAIYIGSSVDPQDPLNCGSNIHLQNAIAFHGLEHFVFTIIELCESSQLLKREQHYLDILFSLAKEFRYNFSPTAGSNLGYKHTEEARANISKAQSGPNHPFYGKSHTEETKARLSIAMSGPNNPMFGRKGELSPIYGTIAPLAKSVCLYNVKGKLVETFTSQVAAAKFLGISETIVRKYIKSGRLFRSLYVITNNPK